MKQFILLAISIAMVAGACKKTEEITYHADDSVYFDFKTAAERDSIVYTFAYEPDLAKDTILLPVRISGIRMPATRSFGIQVVQSSSTAVAGTHYEAFKSSYTMPADSGVFLLPVIILNKDPQLTTTSVSLQLKLLPSADLDTAINTLIKARIVFSNKLEKPIWWNMWLGGYYSQVKHQLFLISSGATDLTTSGLDAPKNLYHVGRLNGFLNDPFTWVTQNVDKGYVLTVRADGNYDFYNSKNPDKKILLRKNTSSGKFYFIDEANKEVI
jgi:hypothetical protein